MAYNAAKAAAAIHKHLCTCSKHGYTQGSGRWGTGHGYCTVKAQGHTFKVPAGDYDCSSSVITAWRLALSVTKYKGKLKAATYTGNMRSVFINSGLFTWKPMSFIAQTGDVYLSEAHHTAMCQTATPDVMSEFLINENGGIVGGKRGDQTGRESIVHSYRVYSFGWDGILHYNGKANSTAKKKAKAKTYTVKSGETLSKIGKKLGVNWKTIAKKNGLKSPYTIHPGDKLKY